MSIVPTTALWGVIRKHWESPRPVGSGKGGSGWKSLLCTFYLFQIPLSHLLLSSLLNNLSSQAGWSRVPSQQTQMSVVDALRASHLLY